MKSYHYYDRIACFYDQMYEEAIWVTLRKAVKYYIENTIKGKKYESVLDVGTGTGYWISFFLEKNLSITAVEPSKKMIELAKKKYRSNVKFFNMRIEQFISDKKFDIVNAQGDVLSYVENLEQVMEKISDLMRKDGVLFATVDSYYYMKKLIEKDGTKYDIKKFEKTHITTVGSQYGSFESRCFTLEDILKLEKYGFKILEIRGCGVSENFVEEIKNSKKEIKNAEHIYFSLLKR
ncbi:class I SAM-dependent DNA methyltransferase [Thermosipho atlanticus]|uniref:Methyltransferase domain-containing protein n=1 Tax=Thermosipho atlanticus DSM 15807 TaxID=1123380 RepID=A0A1M5R7G8_9BACT|nr:class I SAM-dependent methyltransferase [Thermosipho atlanticus]SHH22118.1 Methyltransferase domain-containing protein [Thermosipho atlanticus DSM 15807]